MADQPALTGDENSLLRALRRLQEGGLSVVPEALAREMGVNRQKVASLVADLEKAGLVEASRLPRMTSYKLTTRAWEYLRGRNGA